MVGPEVSWPRSWPQVDRSQADPSRAKGRLSARRSTLLLLIWVLNLLFLLAETTPDTKEPSWTVSNWSHWASSLSGSISSALPVESSASKGELRAGEQQERLGRSGAEQLFENITSPAKWPPGAKRPADKLRAGPTETTGNEARTKGKCVCVCVSAGKPAKCLDRPADQLRRQIMKAILSLILSHTDSVWRAWRRPAGGGR